MKDKIMRRIKLIMLCLATISMAFTRTAYSQVDDAQITIASARHALELKRCDAARKLLDEVAEGSSNDRQWVYVSAMTEECLGRLENALDLFLKYNQLVPGQPKVIDKIADIKARLAVRRIDEQADSERQRKADEINKKKVREEQEKNRKAQEERARVATCIEEARDEKSDCEAAAERTPARFTTCTRWVRTWNQSYDQEYPCIDQDATNQVIEQKKSRCASVFASSVRECRSSQ